jgi:hypothetical protein
MDAFKIHGWEEWSKEENWGSWTCPRRRRRGVGRSAAAPVSLF